MALALSLVQADAQDVEADALLVPVDGTLCRLGGASAIALRAALTPDERDDELAYVTDALLAMRPLADGDARTISDVARWRWLVVSAAYPHDVDGRVYPPSVCAARLRVALPRAFELEDRARSGGAPRAQVIALERQTALHLLGCRHVHLLIR